MPHIPIVAGQVTTPSQIKVLPTYNTGDYGHDIPLHFTMVGATEQAITFSSSAITRSLDQTAQPLDNLPHVYSASDDGLLLHEGNNTAYDTTFLFSSDMPAVIYKTSFAICAGLNISAYTSGNFNLGSMTLTVTETGSTTRTIYQNTFTSTAANQAATGTALHWYVFDLVEPYQVFPNQPIKIRIQLNVTTATGTRQEGIVTIAPFVKTAVLKSFAESCIIFHAHADLSHGDSVFRYNMKRVDQL